MSDTQITFLGRPVTFVTEYALNGQIYVQVEFENGSTGDVRVDDERLSGYTVRWH